MNVISKHTQDRLGVIPKEIIFPGCIFYNTKKEGIYLTNVDVNYWEVLKHESWALVRLNPYPVKYRMLNLPLIEMIPVEFFDFYINQLSHEAFENITLESVKTVADRFKYHKGDPTYNTKELFMMIFDMDNEGIALLRELITGEEALFTVTDLALLEKSIRFREAELEMENKKLRGR